MAVGVKNRPYPCQISRLNTSVCVCTQRILCIGCEIRLRDWASPEQYYIVIIDTIDWNAYVTNGTNVVKRTFRIDRPAITKQTYEWGWCLQFLPPPTISNFKSGAFVCALGPVVCARSLPELFRFCTRGFWRHAIVSPNFEFSGSNRFGLSCQKRSESALVIVAQKLNKISIFGDFKSSEYLRTIVNKTVSP